jgi:hypothetical protein
MFERAVDLLGWPVEDAVTGFSGVATSVSFDLYGCVQVVVSPPMNDKGDVPDGRWFDISRLNRVGDRRVMAPPSSWTERGPAEKPAR